MKKLLIALSPLTAVVIGCLLLADPSEDPPRTFMKSLAKKNGDWQFIEIHLQGYLVDPSLGNTDPPILDEVYTNTGTFHFDNYDGDIDGTGTFTHSGSNASEFTIKVPDFEE